MTTTTLQQLINRMNAYTPIRNMDEVLKVNALDQSIRMFRMNNQPPWTQKKTTLRIFSNVFLYPTATDHEQLAMLDDSLGSDESFGEHPRYVFTSLRDFLEDPDPNNTVAEIWQTGTRFLGVRNKTNSGLTNQLCDSASVAAQWAGSGDASTPVLDRVVFLTGTTSIRVPVTFSGGTATITNTFLTSVADTNYKAKYFFVSVYITGTVAPSALTITLKKDNSNYITSPSLTTQFAGQAITLNDWNVFAFDLNTATETGTTGGTFNSVVYAFTETVNGNYYFDESFLKGWVLQDYWYYSTYNVLNGITYQDYFSTDSATYSLTSVLLGDTAWHDPTMYEACLFLLSDQKETKIFKDIETTLTTAWEKYEKVYPDNTPQITTNVYRFGTDYQGEMGWPDNIML